MTTYRVRPTKPVAVVGAAFGVAVVAVGIFALATRSDDVPLPLLIVWLIFGAAITVFSVWASLAENGRTQTLQQSDDVPNNSLAIDVETT